MLVAASIVPVITNAVPLCKKATEKPASEPINDCVADSAALALPATSG